MVFIVGTASFVSAELFRTGYPSAVFYLVPFRMFELCIGAGLAFMPEERRPPLWAQLAMITGLCAVAYSAIYFDAVTPLRHIWALLPCIGAALVIFAGNTPWSGLLLSNRLATGVGTISYSLYLVHWPIIVFYKYVRSEAIPRRHQLLLMLLCFVAAAAMYWLVERPFRSARTGRTPVRMRTAAIAAVCRGVVRLGTGAAPGTPMAGLLACPPNCETFQPKPRCGTNAIRGPALAVVSSTSRPVPTWTRNSCLKLDPGRPNYLIVGDSFAADAYVYLSAAYPGVNFLQATAGNCHPLLDAQRATRFAPRCFAWCSADSSRQPGSTASCCPHPGNGPDLDPLERTIEVLNGRRRGSC